MGNCWYFIIKIFSYHIERRRSVDRQNVRASDVVRVDDVARHVLEHAKSRARKGGDELAIYFSCIGKDFSGVVNEGKELVPGPHHHYFVHLDRKWPIG